VHTGSTSRRVPQQTASQHHQYNDGGRPTTLSLLKSVPMARSRTDDRIAQMEAKLEQLAQAPPTGTQPPEPAHPSLPAKPGTHPQSASSNAPVKAAPTTVSIPRTKPPSPLVSRLPSPPPPVTSSVVRAVPSRKSNAGLKGVKFVRKKDRTKVEGAGEGSS